MDNLPDFLMEFIPEPQPPVLRKWSFSAWSLFKDVPYLLYAQEVLGRRRESGAAANRGTEMHAELETYVLTNRASGNPDPIGKLFLDTLYEQGYDVQPEKRFTLDANWREVPEESKAMTAILDVFATAPAGRLLIGDYKTGRKYELKHTQQAQLYAAVLNKVYGVDECQARFIYLDGHTPLAIDFNKRIMQQAVDFWTRESEQILSYGKDAFAPPESLQGIPKWYHDFLMDKNNYDPEHFKAPWYAQ